MQRAVAVGVLACVLAATCSAQTVEDRAVAAIVGAFVADAAAMPLHWIYNVTEIKDLVGSGAPEFYYPPSCPYYNYTEGGNSPYGQQTSVYLELIAETGVVDPVAAQNAFYAFYAEGGPCSSPDVCYYDNSTKNFLHNMNEGLRWPYCGGYDTQADAIAHMIPVVALLAGSPLLLPTVATLVRVTQNTTDAVAFGCAAARILEKAIINATTGLDAVTQVAAELEDPNRVFPLPVDAALAAGIRMVLGELSLPNIDVVLQIGQDCLYPYNLWTGSHLIAQQANFVNATGQTIMAGGDNCSRNMFVNSFNAAIEGLAGIPPQWTHKATLYPKVLQWAQQVVGHRHNYL
eukprot:m.375273 g.375273  ORF g.375273 m.375273 type:complete len:346 (+) comp56177_c0_seq12:78-1115(+)